jgi:hypothetical protein
MTAKRTINLVNLDFDTLKEQLKIYLKNQAQFSDYNFDGSNMSVLLDILTYNTHLNAFYLNMIASEMFLDSAQLRNSIISIAKTLNYTPRSTKSSKAILNLRFPQSGLPSFTIPKYTRFTGKNSRGTFEFSTNETIMVYPSGGLFSFDNLNIFEGILTTQTFVVNSEEEKQRFILSNNMVDTDSIEVSVTEGESLTPITYKKVNSLSGIRSTSEIFFVQATGDTRYEIVFGDGVFGKKPADGNIITVTYRIASAEAGNDCRFFTLNDNLGAINGFGSNIPPDIIMVSPSFGGAPAESIEEIRYRAPKSFQAQDRAITVNDFITLITQEFPNIKSVHVYGGEEVLEEPRYGSVYIVPITFTGELISEERKKDIEFFLRGKTNVGITPIVVNPDFLYVDVNTVVRYNPSNTTLSSNDIIALVKILYSSSMTKT